MLNYKSQQSASRLGFGIVLEGGDKLTEPTAKTGAEVDIELPPEAHCAFAISDSVRPMHKRKQTLLFATKKQHYTQGKKTRDTRLPEPPRLPHLSFIR
jgi:hypothetical protein